MFSFTERFLKQIDMYGQRIELNFQKNSLYKTVFGGILTFFILIIFFLGCWFFGNELVYKQKPSVISSIRPVVSPKRIDIKRDNLIIMTSITNAQSQSFIDQQIFTVRAVEESTTLYEDKTTGRLVKKIIETPKKIRPCIEDDLGMPTLNDYFQQVNLPYFYCFDNDQEIFMEGDFDADKFSQVYVYVEKCKNSTTSTVVCKTPQEIDEKLRSSKVQIYISDKYVNPLDFNKPFVDKGIGLYSLTSSLQPRELQLFFANQYIESDVGLLMEEIETQQNYVFVEMKESPYFSDYNVLVRMLFRLQKQKEYLMQRRYLKLADVVAQIGGLLKILIIFGTILSYPITKLYLLKAIVDEVFQFHSVNGVELVSKDKLFIKDNKDSVQIPSPKTKKKKKQEKQAPIKEEQEIKLKQAVQSDTSYQHNSPSLSNFTTMHQNIPEFNLSNGFQRKTELLLAQAKEYFTYSHYVIKYKFIHFFSHAFFPKIKQIMMKGRLVEEGVIKINDHLNVLFILNKLLEIDKLKSILLNQEQLKLFEYIPKPVISDQEPSDTNSSLTFINNNSKNNDLHKISITNKANSKNQDNNEKDKDNQNQSENNQRISKENINNDNQKRVTISTNKAKLNSSKVYSIYKENKSDAEKTQNAYDGLTNILKQEKISKVDEKLINLIDHRILSQLSQLNKNQELLQMEDNMSITQNSYIDLKNQSIKQPFRQIFDQKQENSRRLMYLQANPQGMLKEMMNQRQKSNTAYNILNFQKDQQQTLSIWANQQTDSNINNSNTNQQKISDDGIDNTDKQGSEYDMSSSYFVKQEDNYDNVNKQQLYYKDIKTIQNIQTIQQYLKK